MTLIGNIASINDAVLMGNIAGIKGDTGVGIASITENDDYTITIALTDGSTFTTEPIAGFTSIVVNDSGNLVVTKTDGTTVTLDIGLSGYKTAIEGYKNDAQTSAGTATTQALKAEGNAVGKQNGTDVASGSEYYHNNSKYYSQQALSSANSASTSASNALASETAVSGVKTQLQNRMTAIETEQTTQDARMDSFVTLAEGSTTGDAELIDGRIGDDGITYTNIGSAIRTQFADIKKDFISSNDVYITREGISSSTGKTSSSITRTATAFLPRSTKSVSVSNGYKFILFAFMSNGSYVGVWNGTTFITSGSWQTSTVKIPNKSYLYRMVIAKSDDTTITVSEATSALTLTMATDAKLSLNGCFADSGAIGEHLNTLNKYGIVDILYPYDGYYAASAVIATNVNCTSYGDGTWNIVGTASKNDYSNIIKNKPISPGMYYVDMGEGTVPLRIFIEYSDGTEDTTLTYYNSGYLSVPQNATSMTARFIVASGVTYNETVKYSIIKLADNKYYNAWHIDSTNDTTDRTNDIKECINTFGRCDLGKGVFYINGLQVNDNAKISGSGFETEVVLSEKTKPLGNEWGYGDQSFTKSKLVELSQPLPAGKHTVTVTITSNDTDSTKSAFIFYQKSPYVAANSIFVNVDRATPQTFVIDTPVPIIAIEMFASNTWSHSDGDSATFNDISIVCDSLTESAFILGNNCCISDMKIIGSQNSITISEQGSRHGILFSRLNSSTTVEKGIISGCYFARFSGGCVTMNNTGYSSSGGLNISGCYMIESHIGINIFVFSEFHRIVNCSVTNNYIGLLNNGGNNEIVGCNFSSNYYGISMDNSDGTKNNNSHGGVTGCILQHSVRRAVYINGMGSGFVFTGCNIDDGGVEIVNSTRIIFAGCNFMSVFKAIINGVYPDNGGLVLFNACNFRDSFSGDNVSIINNPYVRFRSCFTQSGVEVDPTN